MTREELAALMTAILYPHALRWSEGSTQTAVQCAHQVACEILQEVAPDVGGGQ